MRYRYFLRFRTHEQCHVLLYLTKTHNRFDQKGSSSEVYNINSNSTIRVS